MFSDEKHVNAGKLARKKDSKTIELELAFLYSGVINCYQ